MGILCHLPRILHSDVTTEKCVIIFLMSEFCGQQNTEEDFFEMVISDKGFFWENNSEGFGG